jgi:hypothetical protein
MSYLARELERHLLWIEARARDLQRGVEQLVEEGHSLMTGPELWDDEHAEVIRSAINDWADNCGRAIASATSDVTEFRTVLNRARL